MRRPRAPGCRSGPSRWHSTSVAAMSLELGDGVDRARHHVAARSSGGSRDARDLARAPASSDLVRVLAARRSPMRPGRGRRRRAAASAASTASAGVRLRADHQHPPLHRDSEEQRVPVGDVADAVTQATRRPRPSSSARAAAVTTRRPATSRSRAVADQLAQQLALRRAAAGRAGSAPSCSWFGPEAQARGQRLDVARRGRGVGQRPGVLVDAERERGRVHRA